MIIYLPKNVRAKVGLLYGWELPNQTFVVSDSIALSASEFMSHVNSGLFKDEENLIMMMGTKKAVCNLCISVNWTMRMKIL